MNDQQIDLRAEIETQVKTVFDTQTKPLIDAQAKAAFTAAANNANWSMRWGNWAQWASGVGAIGTLLAAIVGLTVYSPVFQLHQTKEELASTKKAIEGAQAQLSSLRSRAWASACWFYSLDVSTKVFEGGHFWGQVWIKGWSLETLSVDLRKIGLQRLLEDSSRYLDLSFMDESEQKRFHLFVNTFIQQNHAKLDTGPLPIGDGLTEQQERNEVAKWVSSVEEAYATFVLFETECEGASQSNT